MVSSKVSSQVFVAILFICIGVTHGITCYKCGQYNDGVGSITPCINYTTQIEPQQCPPQSKWCIKYVSEGSTVRDCVQDCVEKDSWKTRTYCCKEDACNSGPTQSSHVSSTVLALGFVVVVMLGHSFRG